ncbi:unnamed protein product [Diabrotica balteata]|uniref:Uncharacterized protein n=1 Tax=Diabrotica balteata TaxID=107213 RepID=A0A9N9XAK1_DIABA|nr:unnamed protein product [Diabrotica balteata]
MDDIENNDTLAMAIFLDPRFKILGFKNLDAMEKVKKNVKAELCYIISNKEVTFYELEERQLEEVSNEKENIQHNENKLCIWSTLDKIVSSKGNKSSYKSSATKSTMRFRDI